MTAVAKFGFFNILDEQSDQSLDMKRVTAYFG